MLNKLEFNLLYAYWTANNCLKDYKPSIDRINSFKPYSFDNIQIMTAKENQLKGHEGKIRFTSIPVKEFLLFKDVIF